MGEHKDKRLAQRLLKGDERAFDAFFATYFPRLYRFALVRLDMDENLADEAAQAALCAAISKLSTYRGEASMFTWLCTICRHEISAQRKASRRAQGDAPLTEDDPAVRAALESLSAGADYAPDVAFSRTEIARFVQTTLDHLPSLYGDALEYKYVHGMSVKEIGERLGKSAKAVESILTRARDAFRDGFRAVADARQLEIAGTTLNGSEY